MDDRLEKKMTILEEIVEDVARALFQRWTNALPKEQRSENTLSELNRNSTESTYFVIKMFMDKFNQAAEQLKDKP